MYSGEIAVVSPNCVVVGVKSRPEAGESSGGRLSRSAQCEVGVRGKSLFPGAGVSEWGFTGGSCSLKVRCQRRAIMCFLEFLRLVQR